MGSFNILLAEIPCTSCGNKYEGKIQFKFGNTWQLRYRIGDVVKWGGNDIGVPGLLKVKVYGILESDICPVCNQINKGNEFDIFLEQDVIKSVSVLEDLPSYFANEGNYNVIET
ncbi:hypothetical protein [Chitinophaga sp. XS-30]|uniref:hypothetical protein n=1 Tax=Chitinophaga sp. XS-30 TaxID=2604421 RepID=UPI0011DCEF47|nr:hypothetical protein [Chitinophaga sp. XS-30]QEH41133.1 hypothetical protein FW415_09705 [Chitinophaga sp. XS-30]